MVTDSQGLLMRVVVQAANIQDRRGARDVLQRLSPNPRLREVRADQGYRSAPLTAWCRQHLNAQLVVTPRDPKTRGFVVQNGRWVIERSFAWLGRYRRLSKDYEQSPLSSEGFIYIAFIHLFLRRLSRNLF